MTPAAGKRLKEIAVSIADYVLKGEPWPLTFASVEKLHLAGETLWLLNHAPVIQEALEELRYANNAHLLGGQHAEDEYKKLQEENARLKKELEEADDWPHILTRLREAGDQMGELIIERDVLQTSCSGLQSEVDSLKEELRRLGLHIAGSVDLHDRRGEEMMRDPRTGD